MMMTLLLLFQSTLASPDIELNVSVRARSVTIQKQGDARLTVTTDPDGGNLVEVRAPKANGRKTLRNVQVNVRAEARIADPIQPLDNKAARGETASPK